MYSENIWIFSWLWKISYSNINMSLFQLFIVQSILVKKKEKQQKETDKECKVRTERGENVEWRTSRSTRGWRERRKERRGEGSGGQTDLGKDREGWRKEIECRLVSLANSVPNRYHATNFYAFSIPPFPRQSFILLHLTSKINVIFSKKLTKKEEEGHNFFILFFFMIYDTFIIIGGYV